MGGKYDDYDWDELPADIQEAATVLGYNKMIWDNDGKAPCEDKDWEELTPAEETAAEKLGYSEETWDDGSGWLCCC
eukprot:scaffold4786_cov198-Amphora_coffeaeformis.AAC.14